ncbi:MAG: LysR substrate-binding domain-containing protein, partial [Methylobacterium sp.]
ASVTPGGPMRANNADALAPALRAGGGRALAPGVMIHEEQAAPRVERVLPDWSAPPISLHLVTPPGEPRPARVVALIDYLARALVAAPWARAAA